MRSSERGTSLTQRSSGQVPQELIVRHPVKESHFSGLTWQLGRRMYVPWFEGGSSSPFSTGRGGVHVFHPPGREGHVLQTLNREGGHVAPTVSLRCLLFLSSVVESCMCRRREPLGGGRGTP